MTQMTKNSFIKNEKLILDNDQFIKYTANRYGLDENTIETFVDIFACSLHEIIHAGASVHIDEIGKFTPITIPKSSKLSLHNQHQLAITFKPSKKLKQNVA